MTNFNKECKITLQQTGKLANKAAAVQWVKWVHPNTEPANTNDELIFIFNPTKQNGKKIYFTDRGFSISDSDKIKNELERQAYYAYISGQYTLNKMDDFGQRINIEITLQCPNGEQIKFDSGWLVYPNGKIINATPCRGELL